MQSKEKTTEPTFNQSYKDKAKYIIESLKS